MEKIKFHPPAAYNTHAAKPAAGGKIERADPAAGRNVVGDSADSAGAPKKEIAANQSAAAGDFAAAKPAKKIVALAKSAAAENSGASPSATRAGKNAIKSNAAPQGTTLPQGANKPKSAALAGQATDVGQAFLPGQFGRFFAAFLPVTKLLYLPELLSSRTKNDLWTVVLLLFALDVCFLFLALHVAKNGGTFPQILYRAFSKPVGKILLFLYVLFFFAKNYLFLGELRRFLKDSLYEASPGFIYFLPAMLAGWYLCTKKRAAVLRAADVLVFLTGVGVIALLLLSLPSADFGALLPVLYRGGNGVFRSVFLSATYFGDYLAAFFFMGEYSAGKAERKRTAGLYIGASLFTTALIAAYFCVFSSLAPAAGAAILNVGKYEVALSDLGRVDYFFIYALLFSGTIAANLPACYATECFTRGVNKDCRTLFSGGYFAVLTAALFFLTPEEKGAERAAKLFGSYACVLMQYLVPLVCFIVFFVRKKREYSRVPEEKSVGKRKTDREIGNNGEKRDKKKELDS